MSFKSRKDKQNKPKRGLVFNRKNAWIIGNQDLDYRKVDLSNRDTFLKDCQNIVKGYIQVLECDKYLLIVNDTGKLTNNTINTMATSLWHEGTKIKIPNTDMMMSPYLEQCLVGNIIIIPKRSDFDFRIDPEYNQFDTTWLDDDSAETNTALIYGHYHNEEEVA